MSRLRVFQAWAWCLRFSSAACGDMPESFEEAVQEIAALRQRVVELQTSLHECTLLMEGQGQFHASHTDRKLAGNTTFARGDAHWHVDEGSCGFEDNCMSSPNFPERYDAAGHRCVIAINSNWTGVLDLRVFAVRLHFDYLTVNAASYSDAYSVTQARIQGTVPTGSILWSSAAYPLSGGTWQLCRSTDENLTVTPKDEVLWTVTEGLCEVDVDGCVVSPNFPSAYNSEDRCRVSIDEAWLGRLDVRHFETEYERDILYVNQHNFSGSIYGHGAFSMYEMLRVTPSGSIVWTTDTEVAGTGWKLCPSGEGVQHPWTGEVWTCQHTGKPCQFPYLNFQGYEFNTCTEYLSDYFDSNTNGNYHDGFPYCAVDDVTDSQIILPGSVVACGPCSCGAGEEQRYVSYPLGALGVTVFISCAPCAAGRFKSVGGYGVEDACSVCLPGFGSHAGATACDACSAGFFSSGGVTCSACAPGSFGGEVQQTFCESCAVGHYARGHGQSACQRCAAGTVTPDTNSSRCADCSPGRFASNDSATTCELCGVGTFSASWSNAACRECSAAWNPGGPNAHLWVTTRQELWKGRLEWTEFAGANTSEACGCAEGCWMNTAGECHTCGEGVLCSGKGGVEVKYGYFATHDNAGFVWRCHGRDQGRCPGGVPGRCAENRQNTSVACGECAPGTRKTTAGPCVACDAGNDWFLALAILFCACLLCGAYCAVVNGNRANEKEAGALLAILSSQMFTMLQMMGVLHTLSVQWPEPFASVVSVASLLNFKVEVLNLGCVVPVSALTRYVMTAFGFSPLFLAMIVLHFSYILVFHWRRFRSAKTEGFTPVLVGAVGTIFMTTFMSVISAIVAPFQCDLHPNGQFTVHAYPQVICWSTAYGSEHQKMIIAGTCASIVPLGFLTMCLWVVRSLPSRLTRGDGAFLHAFAFLFFRFRPRSYWYVLVLVARNAGVALVRILPDDSLQLFAIAVILFPCALVSSAVRPWRVPQANRLDVAINGGFLHIVFLGALFLDTANRALMANVLLAVFGFLLSLLFGSACHCLCSFSKRWRRTYAFFLCHHKQGGGCFARLLKIRLKQHAQVTREVFLDSDNLQDLSTLFRIVGNRVDTLVVLGTQDVLTRSWCLGEIATARAHSLDVILVRFADFRWPLESFVSDVELHVEGLEALVQYGIGLDTIRAALRWLPGLPQIVLPQGVTLACVDAVVGLLVARKGGRYGASCVPGVVSETARTSDSSGGEVALHWVQLLVDARPSGGREVVSVVDHSKSEAVCTAHILKELLKPHGPLMTKVPHVLGADEQVADDVRVVLLVCSTCCMDQASFVRQVVEAASLGLHILPILAEEGFRVPQDWLAECQKLPARWGEQLCSAGDLAFVLEAIFKTIAVGVHPQDSEEALELRARSIATRLSTGTVANLSSECRARAQQVCADLHGRVSRLGTEGTTTHSMPRARAVVGDPGGALFEDDIVLHVPDDKGLREEVNELCVCGERVSLRAVSV